MLLAANMQSATKQQQKTHKNSLANHTMYVNSPAWHEMIQNVVLNATSLETMKTLGLNGAVDFGEDSGAPYSELT